VGQDLVLLSWNSGVNFYIGNNPDYPQTVTTRPGTDWYNLMQRPKQAGLEKPSAQSSFFWGASVSFIREQPATYLGVLAKKTGFFWQGGEIRRNTDIYFARRFSPLLAALVWRHGIAFPFGLLGPLALVGIFLLWKERRAALPLLFVLSYTVVVVAFFVTARHRLPAVPLLILLACYTGAWLKTQLLSRQWGKVLPVGSALLLLGWGLNAQAVTLADDAQERFYMGLAYARKGQVARSTIELEKTLELDPEHYDGRFKLAELYLELGDPARAEGHYRYLVDQAPGRTSSQRNLANICLQDGRIEEALVFFRAIVRLEPEEARSYFGLGGAYRMNGQLQEAEAAYEKALALEPDHFEVRYNLAFVYEQTGQEREAERQYKRLLERRPDHADLRNNLGAVYLKRRDFEAAASEFANVLVEAPNHGRALRNLALAFEGMGRLRDAVAQYEQLIQNGEEERTYNHLARLYRKLGDLERAEEARHKHAVLLRGREILEIARSQAEQLFEGRLKR
jgi:tetratricopeptide (TPR) repeat protein